MNGGAISSPRGRQDRERVSALSQNRTNRAKIFVGGYSQLGVRRRQSHALISYTELGPNKEVVVDIATRAR